MTNDMDDEDLTQAQLTDAQDAIRLGKTHPMSEKTLELLRKDLVFNLSGSNEISLGMHYEHHTAYITGDFKNIRLTYRLIPSSLRHMPYVREYLLRGILVHEVGHYIFTKPKEKQWNQWKTDLFQVELTGMVENIVEDSRINYNMPRHPRVVGENLREALTLIGEEWVNGLEAEFTRQKNDAGGNWPGTMTDGMVISFMMMKGLYGIYLGGRMDDLLSKWFPNITPLQLEHINQCADEIQNCRAETLWIKDEILQKGIKYRASRIFSLMLKYTAPDTVGSGRGKGPTQPDLPSNDEGGIQGGGEIPEDAEGDGKARSDQGRPTAKGKVDTQYIPEYYNGELKGEIDKESKEKFKGMQYAEDKKNEGKKATPSTGAGGGTPALVPPNPPNPSDFKMRQRRLLPQINKMKNMLKTQSKPIFEYKRFRQSGRIMAPMLGKIMGAASRGTVTDIYSQMRTKYEKQDATLFLLVDVSISTNIEMMKDAVTILAEAAGSWISDENFGIYTFGRNFRKIKEINEVYDQVKYRIGGIDEEYSTVVMMALEHIEKVIKGIKKPGIKTLLIVSDFEFNDDADRVRTVLTKIAKMNTIVVGICHDKEATTRDELIKVHERALGYGDMAVVDMLKVEDLPIRFFEIYKKLVFDGMTKSEWKNKGGIQ